MYKRQEEWLYKINKKNERVVFERSNTSEFDLNSLLKQNPKKEEQQFLQFIAKGTPDNQLFLTEVINRRVRENVSDIQELLDVIDWFQNILTVWHPDTKPSWMQFLMESDKKVAASFEEFLKYFDTGIDGIIFKEMDFDKIFIPEEIKQDIQNGAKDAEVGSATWVENQALNIQYLFVKEEDGSILVFKLMTVHNVEGADIAVDHFDIGDESDGTQRIVDFIPMISLLFHSNKVFVVDELERSLHPNLVYEVLNMFLNKSQTSSQLIIAGHESSLLTQKLLRKDEIWFTIKLSLIHI